MRPVKFAFPDLATCDSIFGKTTGPEGEPVYAEWVRCIPVHLPNIATPATYDEAGEQLTPPVYGSDVLVDIVVESGYELSEQAAACEVFPETPNHVFL